MNQEEKKYIVQQRINGVSFVQIGKDLGRSEDAVRVAFNRIMAENRKTPPKVESRMNTRDRLLKCKYCGTSFRKNASSSRRLFCSDKCRNAWANEKKRRVPYKRICEHCGLDFVAFGNPRKRFCSRKCYEDGKKAERDVKTPGAPLQIDRAGDGMGIPDVWHFGGSGKEAPYDGF